STSSDESPDLFSKTPTTTRAGTSESRRGARIHAPAALARATTVWTTAVIAAPRRTAGPSAFRGANPLRVSASLNSRAVWGRSAGTFASALVTAASSAAGTVGRTVRTL